MTDSELQALAQTLSGVSLEATVRAVPAGAQVSALTSLGQEVELEHRLGAGGMGEVFLGRQRSLERQVALKRPRDESGAAALVAEARLSGRLEHPSIVPVHALGLLDDGRPGLLMKRIEGDTLQELIDAPSHPSWARLDARAGDRIGALAEIISRVADALHFAHGTGVFHRDVKPDNVMVGAHGEVYLLDWGVALDAAGRSAPPQFVGTPIFLAPEMLSGAPASVDARTDVFLLGATLHAALTGTPRHQGATVHAVLLAASSCAPVAYSTEVPEELAALCNRATARDPAHRPATAEQFRAELALALRRRGSVDLARRTEARLGELAARLSPEVLAAPGTWETLLECRFALRRALEEHPANPIARAALPRCLELMIDTLLARGDVPGAEALAAQLEPAIPQVMQKLAQARVRDAEARRFEAFGREEARERDLSGAARGLSAIALALMLAGAAIYLAIYVKALSTMWHIAAFDGVLLTALAVLAFAFRRRLLATRQARQLVALLFVGLGAATTTDVLGSLAGLPTAAIAPFTLVSLAAGMAAAGVSFGRAFFLGAVTIALGIPLVVLFRGWSDLIMAAVVAGSNLLVIRQLNREGVFPKLFPRSRG